MGLSDAARAEEADVGLVLTVRARACACVHPGPHATYFPTHRHTFLVGAPVALRAFMPSNHLRTAQLLNTPHVLASLAASARVLGVPAAEVGDVVAEARKAALSALTKTTDGVPLFGVDFDEMTAPRDVEPDLHPPGDVIAFVCWLHVLLNRRAVKRARPAWTLAQRDSSPPAPFVAQAQPQEDAADGAYTAWAVDPAQAARPDISDDAALWRSPFHPANRDLWQRNLATIAVTLIVALCLLLPGRMA